MQDWTEIVRLMRLDPSTLGNEPLQGARFLQRVTASLAGLTAQHRRRLHVNDHEMAAMLTLWNRGRMTMTEMGRLIPLSRAAVTTLTDRLERKGFVKRVPDPHDRRRILLEVQPLFEVHMQEATAGWRKTVNRTFDGLTEEQRGVVVAVLSQLMQAAGDLTDQLALATDAELRGDEPDTPRAPSLPPSW